MVTAAAAPVATAASQTMKQEERDLSCSPLFIGLDYWAATPFGKGTYRMSTGKVTNYCLLGISYSLPSPIWRCAGSWAVFLPAAGTARASPGCWAEIRGEMP